MSKVDIKSKWEETFELSKHLLQVDSHGTYAVLSVHRGTVMPHTSDQQVVQCTKDQLYALRDLLIVAIDTLECKNLWT